MTDDAAGPGTQLLGRVVEDIYSSLKSVAASKRAVILNAARIGFQTLIDESKERRSKVKTLLDPNNPINLMDYYVETNLSLSSQPVKETQFLRSLDQNKRMVVVVGTAGAGKSIFLKYLFLRHIDTKKGQIPLFLELRNINEQSGDKGVLALALSNIQNYLPEFDMKRLRHGLQTGRFALFLDAIDEVDNELRAGVTAEILKLAEENRKASIVCTSRPDNAFGSWEEFSVYKVEGLTESTAVKLIEKISYDPNIKNKFLQEVVRAQFAAHREFLSIPLLLIMMLIVYEQFAEVPDKIVNFYRRAFETLYSKHDASKGGYKRKILTGLALEDFERLFSAFCISTYSAGAFTFDRATALAHAKKAVASKSLPVKEEDIITDLMQAVCVLQQDGLDYTFVHRSFQEYFSALFLVRWPVDTDKRMQTVAALGRKHGARGAFAMMRELEPAHFEKEWVLPVSRAVQDRLGLFSSRKAESVGALIDALYEQFEITLVGNSARRFEQAQSQFGHFWNFVLTHGEASLSKNESTRSGTYELTMRFGPTEAEELCATPEDDRRRTIKVSFASAIKRESDVAKSFVRVARAQMKKANEIHAALELRVASRTLIDESII